MSKLDAFQSLVTGSKKASKKAGRQVFLSESLCLKICNKYPKRDDSGEIILHKRGGPKPIRSLNRIVEAAVEAFLETVASIEADDDDADDDNE